MSDTPTVVLSPAQTGFDRQWGYPALDAITTLTKWSGCAAFIIGYSSTVPDASVAISSTCVAPIMRARKHAPEFKTGLFQTTAAAIARQLLGPDAETPWQQVKTN